MSHKQHDQDDAAYDDTIPTESLEGLDNAALTELVFDRICTIGENAANDESIKL